MPTHLFERRVRVEGTRGLDECPLSRQRTLSALLQFRMKPEIERQEARIADLMHATVPVLLIT